MCFFKICVSLPHVLSIRSVSKCFIEGPVGSQMFKEMKKYLLSLLMLTSSLVFCTSCDEDENIASSLYYAWKAEVKDGRYVDMKSGAEVKMDSVYFYFNPVYSYAKSGDGIELCFSGANRYYYRFEWLLKYNKLYVNYHVAGAEANPLDCVVYYYEEEFRGDSCVVEFGDVQYQFHRVPRGTLYYDTFFNTVNSGPSASDLSKQPQLIRKAK